MFSKSEHGCFIGSMCLVAIGFCCMVVDPEPFGFGILTLWVAPMFLLSGFILPALVIMGPSLKVKKIVEIIRKDPLLHLVSSAVFLATLSLYTITLEPTGSLWDCSEFIAAAYKLQIPHSPGNPLFLLCARIFSMFAGEETTRVAWCVNMMSAVFSALTVYVVFHLIVQLIQQTRRKHEERTPVSVLFSALVGSLCLAASDSFWFSAVEAETYAAASFFVVLLTWLIMNGSTLRPELRDRRLVLIFYIAGLSFCIHPMCLIGLSLLPYYWYTEARNLKVKILFVTMGLGLILVMMINRLIGVGFFELLFTFDLFFVNKVGLPFFSGAFILICICVSFVAILLRRFPKTSRWLWSVIFLLGGFLPYGILVIRSNHNPPIDETNPQDLALLKAYMNRDSYGSAPLIYGPYFDASVEGISSKNPVYYKDHDTYKVAGNAFKYRFDKRRQTVLPRMYSNDPNDIAVYRQLTGLKEGEHPTFLDNVNFMLTFQLGHMYFRYLMFNFAGRESDIQYSRWLRPWDRLADEKDSKARNQYWMLPLLLGVGGGCYHYCKNKKDFFAVLLLLSVTGWLLALYLNSPPNEPRERDYIYVGSYISFSLWIGLGTFMLTSGLNQKKIVVLPFSVLTLSIPGWMLYQNFDDHDRSGRTFQIDNARNVLGSCAPNSILFTGGDNDTFPLWYLQEVEGYRTDVRVTVLSYMNTDWYINQLRQSYYHSAAFKLTLTDKDYLQYGPNDVLYIREDFKEAIDARKYLALIHEQHPGLRERSMDGDDYTILPSRKFVLPISTQVFPANLMNESNKMEVSVKGNHLQKNGLAIIDLLVSNDWNRPVYFNFTSYNQLNLDLGKYLLQEGLVYRLSPFENQSGGIEPDTKRMYQNLIEKASYENVKDPRTYFNFEDYHARMIEPLRSAFNVLAIAFIKEENEAKAREVISYALRTFYGVHLRPSFSNLQAADILLTLGNVADAVTLSAMVFESEWSQIEDHIKSGDDVPGLSQFLLQHSAQILERCGRMEYMNKLKSVGI